MHTPENNQPNFTQFIDLVAERLGGKVLYATDDFFAEKENLIKPGRGVFIPDKYTDRGKWMDGWESRRKRTPGHDYCVIQLATTGTIKGVDIDTNHFLGNHPPFASIEACRHTAKPFVGNMLAGKVQWQEILPKSPLERGSQNFYEITSTETWTHLRLHIYPDGGVARLKVYGEIKKEAQLLKNKGVIDLAAALNGGRALYCNDMFFSSMNNLIMPNRGVNMGDGWETKRNRTPNNRDWVILKLANKGIIQQIIVDTHHFKGNYPDRCSLEGCICETDEATLEAQTTWTSILPEVKLQAHQEHYFAKEIQTKEAFTHVRLNIFPDGGVSRLRLYGTVS